MLKVININSAIDLSLHDRTFIEQVIICAEKDNRWIIQNHLSPLLENMPVFLINKTSMKDLPEYLKYEIRKVQEQQEQEESKSKNKSKHNIPIPYDMLGFYAYMDIQCLKDSPKKHPAVFLCPENIKLLCRPSGIEEYQRLLADVVIHEFAHAKMDDKGEQFTYMDNNREFFDSIEEPFANWFVLKYFYYYGNGEYFHKAEDNIKKQPGYYRLGYDFFCSIQELDDEEPLWKLWKDNKSELVKNENKEWLDLANKWLKANEVSKMEVADMLNKILNTT
jgi:hypothetical protein